MDKFNDIGEYIDNFIDSLPCQSSKEYPKGSIGEKNTGYADLLYDAYASASDSEIQAICQYIYHAKTIANKNIADTLMCISIIEMEHLDKLGEIIKDLGGKPAFYNSNKYYWMTSNIAYGDGNMLETKLDEKVEKDKKAIHEKLMLDIKGEINAINGYKFLNSVIDDKYINKVIDKIISDEEVHIKAFQDLIRDYL